MTYKGDAILREKGEREKGGAKKKEEQCEDPRVNSTCARSLI
jgi:hypothetical protein